MFSFVCLFKRHVKTRNIQCKNIRKCTKYNFIHRETLHAFADSFMDSLCLVSI